MPYFKAGKEMEEKVRKLDKTAALAGAAAGSEAAASLDGNGTVGKSARVAR